MSFTKQERLSYNIHRAGVCENLGITTNNYNYIRRLGEMLHKVLEDDCNGLLTEEQYEGRFNDMVSKIEEKVKEINPDLHVYFQTDPRGATIYLDNKPIEANNYPRSYCIY